MKGEERIPLLTLLHCYWQHLICHLQCAENQDFEDKSYLNLPFCTQDMVSRSSPAFGNHTYSRNIKENFTVRTVICSTKLTQNGKLKSRHLKCGCPLVGDGGNITPDTFYTVHVCTYPLLFLRRLKSWKPLKSMQSVHVCYHCSNICTNLNIYELKFLRRVINNWFDFCPYSDVCMKHNSFWVSVEKKIHRRLGRDLNPRRSTTSADVWSSRPRSLPDGFRAARILYSSVYHHMYRLMKFLRQF